MRTVGGAQGCGLVSYLTNGWCFAARDFRVPRGASDEQARRGLSGASHDVGREKRRGPSGCSKNAPGLRCSSVTDRCGQAPSSRLAPGHSWSTKHQRFVRYDTSGRPCRRGVGRGGSGTSAGASRRCVARARGRPGTIACGRGVASRRVAGHGGRGCGGLGPCLAP